MTSKVGRCLWLVVTVVILATAVRTAAQTFSHRLASDDIHASSCVAGNLLCNTTVGGVIEAGDCTFTDGTRYDFFRFPGVKDQLVTVTLRTIDPSFTTPILQLDAPTGDDSQTPAIIGTSPLTLRYRLSSTGTWGIRVETNDLTAAGRYEVDLSCGSSNTSMPQNCVTQQLTCGQSIDWSLTATSCLFSSSTRPYAYFSVSLVQGDVVEFSAHSSYFDPRVAVYNGGGTPVVTGYGMRYSPDARATFTAPATANYQVAVYGGQNDGGGEFYVAEKCLSVCVSPLITVNPRSTRVPYNGSTTLFVSASSASALEYLWFRTGTSNPLGTGPSLTLTNITREATYFASATNGCGSTNTATATITPDAQPRRRPVKH